MGECGPGGEVSVVIACYTDERWASLEAAIDSVRKQDVQPRRIVVAVDNNAALAQRLSIEFDWITVILNTGERGASATRNRGVEAVDTQFAAFLDDDEIAEPDWLTELLAPFVDPSVVGTGGRYREAWTAYKPAWFPDEFAWAVGGSYLGMPTTTQTVRNVWAGNMAVRTERFRAVDGFRTGFGKRGTQSQPEDTDLCIRMSAAGGIWKYVPTAVIDHEVPAERSTFSFFSRRCFSEGAGKALMKGNLDSDGAIDTERAYAWAMARRIGVRLARFEVLRAFVMMFGLASAAVGYVYGLRRVSPIGARVDPGLRDSDDESRVKPARLVDLELAEPFADFESSLPELSDYRELWVLVRLFETPVGMVVVELDDNASLAERVLDAVRSTCADDVARRLVAAPHEVTPVLSGAGCEHRPPEDVDARSSATTVTVVLCTRNRADDLERALRSLLAQTYHRFDILVVDNAPTDESTRAVVERIGGEFERVAYVVEPRPGLSNARNRGLESVQSDIVAWLDDDEVADTNWLLELVREFDLDERVAAVSGSVVPAELETWPQLWFEQYGGHTKGRSFEIRRFVDGDTGAQSALYPLPPFGVGANMAFRTEILRQIGGFDSALGAGTATAGGEDTLLFTQLLLAKQTVVNAPNALTRHYHRRSHAELERQMFGYGVGLTAFYMGLLRWRWTLFVPLAKLAPRAVHDVLGRSGATKSGVSEEFPRELLSLKTKGMLAGPRAYVRSRLSANQQART